jgi:hypothetical protein
MQPAYTGELGNGRSDISGVTSRLSTLSLDTSNLTQRTVGFDKAPGSYLTQRNRSIEAFFSLFRSTSSSQNGIEESPSHAFLSDGRSSPSLPLCKTHQRPRLANLWTPSIRSSQRSQANRGSSHSCPVRSAETESKFLVLCILLSCEAFVCCPCSYAPSQKVREVPWTLTHLNRLKCDRQLPCEK